MLQAKSAQKRQTAIPLKRRNPVDGTLVIILIMLLLAGLLVLFSATFYTGTSTRSPYSEVLKQLLGIGLGTAACIVTSRIPYRCWQHPYVVVGGLALSAVLLVLVLIIGQVVFSGVMFSMTGALTAISYIIVCRWGMGALGASTDLNDRLSWLKAGLADAGVEYPGVRGGGRAGAVYWVQSEKGIIGTEQSAFFHGRIGSPNPTTHLE